MPDMGPYNQQLCLPEDYKSQEDTFYYDDVPSDVIYQPSVYAFAAHLLRQGGYRYVVDIGCGQGHAASRHFAGAQVIGLDFGNNLRAAAEKMPEGKFFETNLEQGFDIPEKWARHAIIVCSDVIEHLADPVPLLKSLCKLSSVAPFILLSTPDRERARGLLHLGPPNNPAHVREWTLGELGRLLSRHGMQTPYLGYTLSTDQVDCKATSLAVWGAHAQPPAAPAKKVLAIVACRNDGDVIEACFRHLTEQGVDVCFIDDWSTDGTWEAICRLRQERPANCIHVERFGGHRSNANVSIRGLLERKEQIAQSFDYDWYIHQDSDEFRYAPNRQETLADAIARIDALGFNALDHTVLDFRPTDNQFNAKCDPPSYFRFYEFSCDLASLKQVKTFKRQDVAINLKESGGHDTIFPERRVYPLNFQISHFSLRSSDQARKKIFAERLPRIESERDDFGWHTHYERLAQVPDYPDYIWPRHSLKSYSPEQFTSEYLVERLSRIDIA